MTLSKDETMDLLDELTHYGLASIAEEIESKDEDLYEIVKKFYPINGCPTYIEDELIGLKETLQLAAQCYKNALENIKGYLQDDLEILESKKDKEASMKNDVKKKVISHLKEDTKEYKEAIKEDAKLKKVLKEPKLKKKK